MKIRNLFENILENISKDATFRCMNKEKILEYRAKELDALYKEKMDVINFKASILGLNKITTEIKWLFTKDDPSLFDGSFKIPEYFGEHIFGSKHDLGHAEEMDDNNLYHLDDLIDDLQYCGLSNTASILMACVLVDAWDNNLYGVDLRNRKPARNIINDINIVLRGIKNNLCIADLNTTISELKSSDDIYLTSKPFFLDWVLEELTSGTWNVYDAVNLGRRPGKKKNSTSKYDVDEFLNIDINDLFIEE